MTRRPARIVVSVALALVELVLAGLALFAALDELGEARRFKRMRSEYPEYAAEHPVRLRALLEMAGVAGHATLAVVLFVLAGATLGAHAQAARGATRDGVERSPTCGAVRAGRRRAALACAALSAGSFLATWIVPRVGSAHNDFLPGAHFALLFVLAAVASGVSFAQRWTLADSGRSSN